MTSAYSPAQVGQFLDYIELPSHYRIQAPSVELLTALHIHIISKLPYENLSLHYNPRHYVDIDPQAVFEKTVLSGRGRGGFCMEIAILYNHILRAMGFDAYTAAVKTRPRIEGVPRGDFPGWCHIVNIVTFPDGSKYHSDVAFGGDGATMPMPLVENLVHQNLGTQQIRLARDWIPNQVHRVEGSKQWIYQYRNSEALEWNSFYSFPEVEFLQPDWGVVNHWVNTHPDSNQVGNVLVVKFLRRENEIYGKRMLVHSFVKENLGGKTQLLRVCENEQDRVDALEAVFGITLLGPERLAIQGLPLSLDKDDSRQFPS